MGRGGADRTACHRAEPRCLPERRSADRNLLGHRRAPLRRRGSPCRCPPHSITFTGNSPGLSPGLILFAAGNRSRLNPITACISSGKGSRCRGSRDSMALPEAFPSDKRAGEFLALFREAQGVRRGRRVEAAPEVGWVHNSLPSSIRACREAGDEGVVGDRRPSYFGASWRLPVRADGQENRTKARVKRLKKN